MIRTLVVLLIACVWACAPAENNSVVDGKPTNKILVGSYAAHYDAISGEARYEMIESGPGADLFGSPDLALSPNQSAGVSSCAIVDNSKQVGEVGWCMGLIDPVSCTADYNPTTHILSFYAKLVNKSNLANNGSPYTYTNAAVYPPNSTFYGPFVFVITGLVPTNGQVGFITNVNTSLATGACGANGLNLDDAADDADHNGNFDCVYPDKTYDAAYTGYPGWDFSPYVAQNRMLPGADTGCVQFMQFTVTENDTFTLYFDLLAIIDDGTLPPKPTITSHADEAYVKTSSITLAGANCTNGGSVRIEGGASNVTTTCSGGAYSVSVPMILNSTNTINVYQIVGGKQSASTTIDIHHDNVAPTVVSFSPANNETSVSQNTNCLVTFNEAMKSSTMTSTNLQIIRVSNSASYTGAITPSPDLTQAVITSTPKPLPASNQFDCKALTGLTDLAGNNLAVAATARFTTAAAGGIYSDLIAPKVTTMLPFDNTQNVSTGTTFTVRFDEPIDPATIVGNVVDGTCNTSGGNIPNVFVFELASCNASPVPITGTTSLSADGLLATFTPSVALQNNNCYGFVVSSCVKDLSGNSMANRGTRTIGAYSSEDITYNSYSVFFTGGTDSVNPTLVSVGPILDTTNVHERVFSHMVFSEPIDPATVVANNLYMTILNQPDHLALNLNLDPTSQVVTFEPTAALGLSTSYAMTVTGALSDFAGNQMAAPQTSKFLVRAAADTTAPTIVRVTPASGTSVNDKCPYVDIYFSEPMKNSTLNGTNVKLVSVNTGTTKPTSVEIDDDGMHVRLIPVSSLATGNGTTNDYTVTVTTGVTDRAGNALGAAYNGTFQVLTDTTVPSVTAVVPPNAGTISQNGSVLTFFSEEMDKSTITETNHTITGCTPIIFADPAGRWSVANCINQMTTGVKTLRVNRDVRDFYNGTTSASCEAANGNRMAANFTSIFTVAAGNDTTAPTISALSDVTPLDLAVNVSTAITPSVRFSEAIDPRTVMPSSIYLMDKQGNRVSATISISTDARTVTLTPVSALTNPGIYYIVATTAIRDLGGGNAYTGTGGEISEVTGVLRSCFSTNATTCP